MNETYRNIAVIFEVERSIKYLRLGLTELQKISGANDFYDPLLMYLSGGLERLFKTMLCMNYKEVNGRLPNRDDIWNYKQGHDIVFLKSKVETICVPINRPFAESDYQLITEDPMINSICNMLSEYGKRSRYFNLDAILGVEQSFDSSDAWQKMETEIGKNHYGEKKFYNELKQLDNLYAELNNIIIVKLESFLRAICRQFIFGEFSSESKSLVSHIWDFSNIEDEQLGKTHYADFNIYESIRRH